MRAIFLSFGKNLKAFTVKPFLVKASLISSSATVALEERIEHVVKRKKT